VSSYLEVDDPTKPDRAYAPLDVCNLSAVVGSKDQAQLEFQLLAAEALSVLLLALVVEEFQKSVWRNLHLAHARRVAGATRQRSRPPAR
jgi:hypothetical protein